MTAGLNIRIKVWRLVEMDDDASGGVVMSGSVLCDDVEARLQALKPNPILLQQGLETDSLFRCMVPGSDTDYREFDELEIVAPADHKYYQQLFEIRKVQEDSLHPYDRRNFVEMTLSKIKYSRSNFISEA